MFTRVLSFDAFVQHLLEQMDLDLGDLTVSKDTHVIREAGLDSVAVVEVLAIIEELGSDVDDRALESTFTFGDLYHLYTVGRVSVSLDSSVLPDL